MMRKIAVKIGETTEIMEKTVETTGKSVPGTADVLEQEAMSEMTEGRSAKKPDDIGDISWICQEVEENYKYLHQHPELGFEEYNTSRFILDRLEEYGIRARQTGGTGVIATIYGDRPGKTVGIRADMDALPLTEEADVPYRSCSEGVMHACGHDAHVAMLLGAARYLSGQREKLCGNVRLIFQPAEEGMQPERLQEIVAAGGSERGGAATMIAMGALEDVDCCYAIHMFPELPTGTLAVGRERAMASSDIFRIDICGKGGHGSSPETAVDPVGALAAVLAAFNAFPSRELSALDSCSLSVGTINTDSVWNAIPDKIHVEGGVRLYDNKIREYTFRRLPQIVEGICSAHRCHVNFERQQGYDPTINAPEISERMAAVATRVFGEGRGTLMERPAMGSEDAGYYFQKVPGAIAWLGCHAEGSRASVPHNPGFYIDLKALGYGVLFHINMVFDILGEE